MLIIMYLIKKLEVNENKSEKYTKKYTKEYLKI